MEKEIPISKLPVEIQNRALNTMFNQLKESLGRGPLSPDTLTVDDAKIIDALMDSNNKNL